jgi:hypothetical protein
MVTDVRVVLSLNAKLPIEVTGYVNPSYETLFGMTIFFIEE